MMPAHFIVLNINNTVYDLPRQICKLCNILLHLLKKRKTTNNSPVNWINQLSGELNETTLRKIE